MSGALTELCASMPWVPNNRKAFCSSDVCLVDCSLLLLWLVPDLMLQVSMSLYLLWLQRHC